MLGRAWSWDGGRGDGLGTANGDTAGVVGAVGGDAVAVLGEVKLAEEVTLPRLYFAISAAAIGKLPTRLVAAEETVAMGEAGAS